MPGFTAEERLLLLRFLGRAALAYARSSIKNCVKILIGRKPYYNDRDLFFRQYLLHLTGIRRITRITCPGLRNEGPGSQALMTMSAISFARAAGLAYVHTPFSAIAHGGDHGQGWSDAWERLFNLGAGELTCKVPRHRVVNFCYNFSDLALCFGWHSREEELADHLKASLPDFRRKFRMANARTTADVVRVALHLRRGEVSPASNSHLFTRGEAARRTLSETVSVLAESGLRYRVSVYSEGSAADFEEILLAGVPLRMCRIGGGLTDLPDSGAHRTERVDDTGDTLVTEISGFTAMRELVDADILITAKSSFSYYAALISEGIAIFEPERPALAGWIVRAPDGSFDKAELRRRLDLRTAQNGKTAESGSRQAGISSQATRLD